MTPSTQGEIRPTAFDSFADATLAAIACNKAQATVGALLRQDARYASITTKLAEAADRLHSAMHTALQLHQGATP